MEHCCQSCGSSQPVAAFQSSFETLQTCSTCQEQKAQAQAQLKAQHCVVLAPLSESELNCSRECVNAQEQQAQPKQQCVVNNQQCFCSDCQSLLSVLAFQSNNPCCITCEEEYRHCSCCDSSQPVAAFQSDLQGEAESVIVIMC